MNKHTGRWNEWSARWILERCVRHGVTDVVLCPGSRSTPLAIAASGMSELTVRVHFDERGAAFFALGLARATERPVIWLTTSGTAVANGLPAVVEASQSRVPLILLTADRPPELRGCGANQAIDQVQIFGSYCRYFSDISCSNPDMTQGWYESEVDRAFRAARQAGASGPVHLNLMIREPFLEEKGEGATAGRASRALEADLEEAPGLNGLTSDRMSTLTTSLQQASEGLLVIGGLHTQAERQAVEAFAQSLGWPCVADVDSGLRFSEAMSSQIQHMDLLLLNENIRWSQPDVVLWVGGPVVSRRLLEWMGSESRSQLIRVSSNRLHEDPLHRAHAFYVTSLEKDLPALAAAVPSSSSAAWVNKWQRADRAVGAHLAQGDLTQSAAPTQPEVAHAVTDLRDTEYSLFVGNSLSIRELDQFGAQNSKLLRVGANRGASGIDGLIATSAGFATGTQLPTLAVLGDLSALHDLNSLALLKDVTTPFILLVVNNDGGGIFNFLPIRDQVDVFEKCFATPHGASFEAAAAVFNWTFQRPDTLPGLRDVLRTGLAQTGVTVVEVVTDRQEAWASFEELAEAMKRLSVK